MMPGALPTSDANLVCFHCPNEFCSSVAVIADARAKYAGVSEVKLLCSLRHAYWLPISQLQPVAPHWPVDDDDE